MLLPMWFLITCELAVVFAQRFNPAASSCRETYLKATSEWQSFTSPNYPKKFPKQTQCGWRVTAPDRYRVELQFKFFYLLGSGRSKSCAMQYTTVRDIFSGITDGPYCGNTLPPVAVSTGRSLRIALESNAVRGYNHIYQGFEAFYRATRQPSSLRLRDSTGKWQRYRVIGGDLIETTTPTVATMPTRDPNEIDDNNNAEIDRKNNLVNNRNANNNQGINERNNNPYGGPAFEIDEPPLRPPKNPRFDPMRISSKPFPTKDSFPVQVQRPAVPPKNQGRIVIRLNEEDDSDDHQSSGNAILIGGMVGGIVGFLLVALFVAFLVRKKMRKDNKSSVNKKEGEMMKHMQPTNQRTPSSHRSRKSQGRKMTTSHSHESEYYRRAELPGRRDEINSRATDHNYQRRKRSRDRRSNRHHRETNFGR